MWGRTTNDLKHSAHLARTSNTTFIIRGLEACEVYLVAVMVEHPFGLGPKGEMQVGWYLDHTGRKKDSWDYLYIILKEKQVWWCLDHPGRKMVGSVLVDSPGRKTSGIIMYSSSWMGLSCISHPGRRIGWIIQYRSSREIENRLNYYYSSLLFWMSWVTSRWNAVKKTIR